MSFGILFFCISANIFMLFAANISLSCFVWQDSQVQVLSERCRFLLISPQIQSFDEGAKRPILMIFAPLHSALYSRMFTKVDHDALCMLLFNPAFCLTMCPGASIVPLAEALIPFTFKLSKAIVWFSANSFVDVFCKKSVRWLVTLS